MVSDQRWEVNGVWTLMHKIDKSSPLFMATVESLNESRTHIHVAISGTDPVTDENVLKMAAYAREDVLFGYNFEDQLMFKDGVVYVDFDNLSKLKPAEVWYPTPQTIEEYRRLTQPKSGSSSPKPDETVRMDRPASGLGMLIDESAVPNRNQAEPVSSPKKEGVVSGYGSLENSTSP